MRLHTSGLCALLLATVPCPAAVFCFHVTGGDPGSWPAILSSMGMVPGAPADSGVVVIPSSARESAANWMERVGRGTILIVEGDSPAARELGFRATSARVVVRSLEDVHAPKLGIVWEHELNLPKFDIPADARVFASEPHSGAPLIAGMRREKGAVLWVAAPPGERGYERFPYLPQALADLRLVPAFRSTRMWAFFDSSYRARVDLDYFARKWRESGISALQVAAWHHWERDPAADAYLDKLIQACHRNAILVYAWLELPHVSERFWAEHPEWREKTALLQDAQLDWRKLMNLTNRPAFAAVSSGLRDVVNRFDWDGVNLAELYFESLDGHENAARFTPMNNDVREQFRMVAGFDPVTLFDTASPKYFARNATGLSRFLDFRAELARRQEQDWLGVVEQLRPSKPHLDVVLTHVDDRLDPTMRNKIGADASQTLPLLKTMDFTFLVEDPANLWDLGPDRYPNLAARYRPIAPRPENLGIDINVVERYQDVYPTKQPTGAELMQLIHTAATAFPRLALYFESSIPAADWPLLANAAANVKHAERSRSEWKVDSSSQINVLWGGPALVDGKPWPLTTGSEITLPPGPHTIEPSTVPLPLRILDFSGELKAAAATPSGVELRYDSSSRAFLRPDRTPAHVAIDGTETQPDWSEGVLTLPRGKHTTAIW